MNAMDNTSFQNEWLPPPSRAELSASEAHVWRAGLNLPEAQEESLLALLTQEEKDRANRFYRKRDRSHFINARGMLRDILGRYLGMRPESLRFDYTYYGKPSLKTEFGGEYLRFNLSHAEGVALYGVTASREIGIDIEWIRPGVCEEGIAERFFSAEEVKVLRALPKEVQEVAFFNCWTRKEAYIKAKGEGLSMPLDRFVVTLAPGERAQLISTVGDAEEASRWRLVELFPGPGFVGAIAVEGHDWQPKLYDWRESAE